MHDHDKLMEGICRQLKPVLEKSGQAVYIYLDDGNIACNKKFASLLGYGSPKEMLGVKGSFLNLFVAEGSRHTVVSCYRAAMEKMVGSTAVVSWKKKSGGSVKTAMILVPVAYEGHLFALHFITKQ